MLAGIALGLIALIIGGLFCFFGIRFFRVILPIWGFVAGFGIVWAGTTALLGSNVLAWAIAIVVGLVAGLVLAALSYFFFVVGLIILGATFGWGLGTGLVALLGDGMILTLTGFLFGLVGAVIFGGLMLAPGIRKLLVGFMTAFGGASYLIAGVLSIFGIADLTTVSLGMGFEVVLNSDNLLAVLAWIILGVIGLVWQIRTSEDVAI